MRLGPPQRKAWRATGARPEQWDAPESIQSPRTAWSGVHGLEADQLGRISCSSHHLWALRCSTPPPNFSLLQGIQGHSCDFIPGWLPVQNETVQVKQSHSIWCRAYDPWMIALLSRNVNYPTSKMKMVHTFEEGTGHDMWSASSWATWGWERTRRAPSSVSLWPEQKALSQGSLLDVGTAEAGWESMWTLYKFSATCFLTLPRMFFPMGKWPITVTNWIVSPQIHRWKPCAPMGLYLEMEPLRR